MDLDRTLSSETRRINRKRQHPDSEQDTGTCKRSCRKITQADLASAPMAQAIPSMPKEQGCYSFLRRSITSCIFCPCRIFCGCCEQGNPGINAIINKRPDKLQKYLAIGSSALIADSDGNNMLHHLFSNKEPHSYKLLKTLLNGLEQSNKMADLQVLCMATNDKLQTPAMQLLATAENEDLSAVQQQLIKQLLLSGYNPFLQVTVKRPEFFPATRILELSQEGDDESLRLMLIDNTNTDFQPAFTKASKPTTLLCYTIRNRLNQQFALLVSAGANLRPESITANPALELSRQLIDIPKSEELISIAGVLRLNGIVLPGRISSDIITVMGGWNTALAGRGQVAEEAKFGIQLLFELAGDINKPLKLITGQTLTIPQIVRHYHLTNIVPLLPASAS